jgi:hypothetical protein
MMKRCQRVLSNIEKTRKEIKNFFFQAMGGVSMDDGNIGQC